jgi:HYR domain
MRTKWTLAAIGAMTGMAVTAALAPSADLQRMVIDSIGGTVHIEQHIPCSGFVDRTIAITGGRLELTPSDGVDVQGVPGGKAFTLTRANVSVAPFSVQGSCVGFSNTRNYTEAEVQLAEAASFTATAAANGVYNLSIPKGDFRLFQASIVNGALETGYKHPSQDVTGTINLTTGAVTMHVVLATTIHFEEGCVQNVGCLISEDDDGTLTADLTGTIAFPDADGDTIPDRSDNCRFVANVDQHLVSTPVVTPPFDLTLASCTDHRIGGAIGTDVCDATPVDVTNNAPLRFAVGPNLVTWRGEDANHRTATASQTVTVVDTTSPIFTVVPPHIDLNDCGSPALGVPTAIDDCAGTVAFTNNAPGSFGVGTTVVTWTATDASSNHATATQSVTVIDTVASAVSCVATNPTGNSFVVTATDACSTPIIRLGSFVIANGETIKINETGQPGVRLMNDVSADHSRHFQVGRGEGIITATDPSGNVGTALCR